MADPRDKLKHPMQPVGFDDDGVIRFKQNAIVRYLLDAGPFDLNHTALLPGVSREDHEQLAQLIGYSVSGFGELSYVSDEAYAAADREAEKLRGTKRFTVVHFETRRFETTVHAKDEEDARAIVKGMDTDEGDLDNEFYEWEIADVKEEPTDG